MSNVLLMMSFRTRKMSRILMMQVLYVLVKLTNDALLLLCTDQDTKMQSCVSLSNIKTKKEKVEKEKSRNKTRNRIGA